MSSADGNERIRQALLDMLGDREAEAIIHDRIDDIIETELAKGDEMDADLITEALDDDTASGGDGWNAERLALNWDRLEERVNERLARGLRYKRLMHHLRVIAASVACIFILSVGVATAGYAFNWTFIRKVITPLMETMGFTMNIDEPEELSAPEKDEDFDVPDSSVEASSVVIRDLKDVPRTIRGYSVMPGWLPSGYAFARAEYYADANESRLVLVYMKDQAEMAVQLVVYARDSIVARNDFEADGGAAEGAGKAIHIEENDGIVFASYSADLTYYNVWGPLSTDEAHAVITSIQGVG